MDVWCNKIGEPARTWSYLKLNEDEALEEPLDLGMFLSLFVFLVVTTCCCSPLSTRVVEENKAMSTMAEDLQLEVQSNIYAADWSSLERMAQFFKVEYEGKSKLLVAKRVVERLEEEIGKLKESEIVPYLEDVKKILTEKPFLASRMKIKVVSQFLVILNPLPQRRTTRSKSCWLLALYVDNSRSVAKSGNPSRKIK